LGNFLQKFKYLSSAAHVALRNTYPICSTNIFIFNIKIVVIKIKDTKTFKCVIGDFSMKIANNCPVNYTGSQQHWTNGRKSLVENFLDDLDIDVGSNGGHSGIEVRNWKENEGVLYADECPKNMNFATVYLRNVKWSGLSKLDRAKYNVECGGLGFGIRDKYTNMSVRFLFSS